MLQSENTCTIPGFKKKKKKRRQKVWRPDLDRRGTLGQAVPPMAVVTISEN